MQIDQWLFRWKISRQIDYSSIVQIKRRFSRVWVEWLDEFQGKAITNAQSRSHAGERNAIESYQIVRGY